MAQFFRALSRHGPLSSGEYRWVCTHLSPGERTLFFRMDRMDQKHAVAVSMDAAQLARERNLSARQVRTLIRAGLLHDVGKADGNLTLWHRVLYVLVRKGWPNLVKRWSQEGIKAKGMRQAFYIQSHHGERGAQLARQHGVEEEVVRLIWGHQLSDARDDDELLTLLVLADERR